MSNSEQTLSIIKPDADVGYFSDGEIKVQVEENHE